MKNLFLVSALALALALVATAQAQVETSGDLVGEYFGVALPANCTSERLIVIVTVGADYTLTGRVVDWDNAEKLTFEASWPFFSAHTFSSTTTPALQSGVRGSISARAGALAGVVDLRPAGGCRYTFKAFRRLKRN